MTETQKSDLSADKDNLIKSYQAKSQALLIEMLQEGYHLAFRELFNLLQNYTELGEQSEALLYIRDKLTIAEYAQRKGDFEKVYDSQVTLARYFQEKGYKSLAILYYESSYQSSSRLKGEGRKKEAEVVYYLGKFAELEQDYCNAQKYFEQLKSLTKGCDWYQDGFLFYELACECLQRVYIQNAVKMDHVTEKLKIVNILNMAYLTVKEGGSTHSLGDVILITGDMHASFGELIVAINYYKEYLELCKSVKDNTGVLKAYQALASAYERADDIEKALECLKMLLDEAQKSNDANCIFETCKEIGALYNSQGNYEQSVQFYKKALAISSHRDDECCKSEYAIALANFMQNEYIAKIVQNDKDALKCILDWKCERIGFNLT